MNKLLYHIMQAGDVSHKFLPNLPKAQKGYINLNPVTRPVYDNIPSPAMMRAKVMQEEKARAARYMREQEERQGSIRQAGPPQSTASKVWNVMTHPMTALEYKIRGRDLPEHFERGPQNNLDIASSIINPFFYTNEVGEFSKGLGNAVMHPMDQDFGTLATTALHGLGAIPAVNEFGMALAEVAPAIRRANIAYKATSDLPILTRIHNTANAAALEAKLPGDVPGHTYFGMSPEEARLAMTQEMANLPEGAYSMDLSMSKNSAPLFWTQAARSPKNYTMVRTGDTQQLNWSGIKGKRVTSAVPSEAMHVIPEVAEYQQSLKNRIEYLRGLNEPKYLAEADRLEKEGVASQLIADLPQLSYNNPDAKNVWRQFMENYKPTLDNPIEAVNQRTGLNFPKTQIVENPHGGIDYYQPTIAAVKGNPLSRIPRAVGNYIGERANKFYLGDLMKPKYNFDLSRSPRRNFANGIDPQMFESSPFTPTQGTQTRQFADQIRNNIEPPMIREDGSVVDPEKVMPPEYAHGGPIIDPRGQWAHPGRDTIIPSRNITMKGVPYPVYGQDNTGYGQMMYPGGEYTFPGQMVYEKPMMQKGGTNFWKTDKKAWVDSVNNANLNNIDFVQRFYDQSKGSMQIPGQPGRSTHFMAYDPGSRRVYPEVVNVNGKLQYMPSDAGYNYADSTGQYITFPTAEQARWYASSKDNTSGYKMGTDVLKGFESGGQHGGLDRWFAEKWIDIKTGKPCGREEGENRKGYPACRPSRRVNSHTPKTASELSTTEREKFKRSKTSSQRINYNHKRN